MCFFFVRLNLFRIGVKEEVHARKMKMKDVFIRLWGVSKTTLFNLLLSSLYLVEARSSNLNCWNLASPTCNLPFPILRSLEPTIALNIPINNILEKEYFTVIFIFYFFSKILLSLL